MTATAAEALELALWLHRAPARRAALAGRPLPEGIGQLLRIAGGAGDQVAAAARITGTDEATILEAVRFYLQQMLFQDEDDAYRVLGLAPGASQAQAREHHRLLQHWLHPDRRGHDQWETVYATRVNRAWTRLRTPQARAAYDATLATRPVAADRGSRHGGEPTAPLPLHPAPSPRNHSRNLTLVVLLGCAGLLALIALRNEQPPEWRDERAAAPHPATETAPAVPDGSALAASLEALAAGTVAQVETAAAAMVQPDPLPPPPAARPVGAAMPAPVGAATAANASPRPPAPPRPRLPGAAAPRPAPVGAAMAANLPPQPPTPPPPAIVLAAATPAPALPAPAAPIASQPVPDPLDRMRQARTRARQVLAYLGDPTAVQPPVWNDLATAQSATALRAALLDRLPTGARLDLREPQWRLSPDGARLESAYVADAHGGGGESGRIALDFVWREDRLLVRGLSLVAQ